MPRHRHKGSTQRREVQRHHTGPLGGVHDQGNASPAAQCRNLLHRLNEAKDIGHLGTDDCLCIWCNGLFKGGQGQLRAKQRGICRQRMGLEGIQRAGHCVVFIAGDHHPATGMDQRFNGDVQAMGGIAGKHHLLWGRNVKQLRDLTAAAESRLGRRLGRGISAPARGGHSIHGLQHGLPDGRGLLECGGGTVKVNHAITPLYAKGRQNTSSVCAAKRNGRQGKCPAAHRSGNS